MKLFIFTLYAVKRTFSFLQTGKPTILLLNGFNFDRLNMKFLDKFPIILVFTVYILLIVTPSLSITAEKSGKSVVKCIGSSWDYYYELWIGDHQAQCNITNYVQRKSGKVSKINEKHSPKCWESLARTQLDGARCCFTSNKGTYYQFGNPICK